MSDEIKEILEGIQVVITHDGTIEFNTKELKILLDYITNLQKRIFSAREMIFDNYGVLDKYGIEMLDDILTGGDKE